MIVRKLSRAALLTQRQSLLTNSYAPSLNQSKLAYSFSEKKPDEDRQQKVNKILEEREEKTSDRKFSMKAMDFKEIRKQLSQGHLKNNLGRYVNRMLAANRFYEGAVMGKLRTMSRYLYESNPEEQEQKEQNRENIKSRVKWMWTKKYLIQFTGLMILLYSMREYLYQGYSIVLKQLLTDEADQERKQLAQRVEKMKNDPKELEGLLNQLAGVATVRIIQNKSFKVQNDKSRSPEGQEKGLSMMPHYQTYNIILEHQDGRKIELLRYYGDPSLFLEALQKVQKKLHVPSARVYYEIGGKYTFGQALSASLEFLTPFIGLVITLYLFRMNDPKAVLKNFGMGKSNFKIYTSSNITTKFRNVIGMTEAKKEIAELIDFLKFGEKYKNVGAKIPKGALLTGPPGTGKTMLARACAGEAGVAFFSISGSEFVEIFVGVGASKVRDLFAQARAEAPSIIFIDEIDAIGKKRQNSRNEEKDSTLNQLLVEMDGFSTNETVIVLAATNRKETLDSALTRPGRFDRMIEINLPQLKDRRQIFAEYLVNTKIDPRIGTDNLAKRLAELTPGFSGADINNLVNEAAIIAARKEGQYIQMRDFQEASERITAGYVKKNLMNIQKKRRVAFHEAGHAVSGWFLKGGDPLLKITIVPRSKGALGYAQYVPKTAHILSKDVMIDRIAIMLGGITSEELFLGQMSSGGSDDLQKVYDLTRRMVTQFGMGRNTYNMTLDMERYVQKESTFLSDLMDQEMFEILEEAKKRSRQIIEEKKDIIQNLANQLLKKETLNQEDIIQIMGERPNFGEHQEKEETQYEKHRQETLHHRESTFSE